MRRMLGLSLLLFWLAWPQVAAAVQVPQEVVVVAAGEQVAGDIATTGRAIIVEGEVLGDVTSWSGDITVRGHVHGDVVSYSGAVVIASRARVDGNVLALLGSVRADGLAAVGGRRFDPRPDAATASVVGQVVPGAPPPPLALRAVLVSGVALLLVALCIIFPSLWPLRSAATLALLRRRPWLSIAFGLLTGLLLALALVPLATLLALTLVGLVLILPLVLLVHLIYSYGLAILAQMLGQQLGRPTATEARLLGGALLVLPIALLALVMPVGGALLFYTLGSAGLGAAALTRGGTLQLADYM